jgi:hypothetical protein
MPASSWASMAAGQTPDVDLASTLADAGPRPGAGQGGRRRSRGPAYPGVHAAAEAAVGARVGVPVVVPETPAGRGFLGPIVFPPPTGADALALWDALIALAVVPGIYEISSPRPPRLPIPQQAVPS